jgi:formylglycine-generating enzyme required for sulfatase activity
LIAGGAVAAVLVTWVGFFSGVSERAPRRTCPEGTSLENGECVENEDDEDDRPKKRPPVAPPRPVPPPKVSPNSPLDPEPVAVCPSGMVRIGGGSYELGESKRNVSVRSICVDETEVTVEAYARCATCSKDVATERTATTNLSSWCNWDKPDRQKHPINCVDWNAAATYCSVQGKRLPTEEEWEWAARGGVVARIYPWGADEPHERHACALRRSSSCPVGSYSLGRSHHGLHDLAGNVAEWTSTPWGDAYVFRGGDFFDQPLRLKVTARYASPPTERHYGVGFRCVK